MDSRSKKSRSLAIDPKPTSQKRPELGDRHNSAPLSNRQRESQSKRISAATKASDASRRSSRASTRDDGEGRTASNRLTERRPSQPANDPDDLTTFSFVVLGGRSVGKTGFIRNALDLRGPSPGPFASSKVSLAGNIYRVQLIELSYNDVELGNGREITWPHHVNGSPMPSVQGAFCLYDVSDQESIAFVPRALSTLSNSDLPCVLVACKTDVPEEEQEVSSRFHDQVRRSFTSVSISETSKDDPESQKRCILKILNRILRPSQGSPGSRSRNQSLSRNCHSTQHSSSRNSSPEKTHSRSRSHSRLRSSKSKDLLLNIASRPPIIESGDEGNADASEDQIQTTRTPKTKLRVDTSNVARPPARPADPHTPVSSGEVPLSRLITPSDPVRQAVPETPESYYVKSMLRPSTADTADSRAFQTFLNMDDDPHDDSPAPEHEPAGLAISKMNTADGARQDQGVPFRELVERLLLLPTSKHDSKFVPSFLCLYRSFATPRQLLESIIIQFVKTEKGSLVQFAKVAEQLRYLQVLAQWTALYPGDFAGVAVREIATEFVQSLEKTKSFAPAARELSNNLDAFVADDDLDWAYNDDSVCANETSNLAPKTATSSSNLIPSSANDSANKLAAARGRPRDNNESDEETGSSTRGSGAPSTASSMLRTANSSQSHQNLQQLAHARDQAKKFRPNPHIRMTKVQWHQFMEYPVEELAKEITRIDWSMYSAIRPRDFVRHVTLSESKRRLRKTDNISVMVRQFNHLALFVSGLILLRDKPKHRAKAMEKFMALAWKVRQLNNYNSLGAIVAGITGHEIGRLVATRDLVPAEVQKQFLRLTILMGISRSHAAYRMAWDNSFQERIPFIPLVRQDLTMASSANPTFVGKSINWKKFEIMGETIVGIQKSLEMPYSFQARNVRSDEIIKLVLESRILDESEDSADPRSELYERSVQLEPQPGADSRKKFEWLRR